MTPDQRAALRKLHNRNVARFHGGMRRAAKATKKLVKTTPISQWPDDALVEDVPKRLAKQKTTEVKR